jgi:hypothetical protein
MKNDLFFVMCDAVTSVTVIHCLVASSEKQMKIRHSVKLVQLYFLKNTIVMRNSWFNFFKYLWVVVFASFCVK